MSAAPGLGLSELREELNSSQPSFVPGGGEKEGSPGCVCVSMCARVSMCVHVSVSVHVYVCGGWGEEHAGLQLGRALLLPMCCFQLFKPC